MIIHDKGQRLRAGSETVKKWLMPNRLKPWPQDLPQKTTLGQRFSATRAYRGLSQSKLAKIAGCTRGMIGHIETDKVKDLQAGLIFKLSDALEVSARWLLWGTGPVHKWEILSQEERELLDAYRTLPPPLQEHARGVLNGLMTAVSAPSKANPVPTAPRIKNRP